MFDAPQCLVVFTRSFTKEEFYRNLFSGFSIPVVPSYILKEQATPPAKEIGTSRRENISGKGTNIEQMLEEITQNPVKFWGTLFFNMGWIPAAALPRTENPSDFEDGQPDWESLTSIQDLLGRVLEDYETQAKSLTNNPQKIAFLADDSKTTLDNIRFSDLETLSARYQRQRDAHSDALYSLKPGDLSPQELDEARHLLEELAKQDQALSNLLDIIHHACLDIAEEAWEKEYETNSVYKNEVLNDLSKKPDCERQQSLLAIKKTWSEDKAQKLYQELHHKKFPGAIGANLFSAAGGEEAFFRLVFEAFGKGVEDTFDLYSASTLNVYRLKKKDNGDLGYDMTTLDGDSCLRGKNEEPHTLIHPDKVRTSKNPPNVITLDAMVLVDGVPLTDETVNFAKYGGRAEALAKAGLLPEMHQTPLPIRQTNIPVAVLVASETEKESEKTQNMIATLKTQGHIVDLFLMSDVLPEVNGYKDDCHSCANSEIFQKVVDQHGVFVISNDDSAISHLMQARLLDYLMIGPLSVRSKRMIVLEDQGGPHQIDSTLNVLKSHGLATHPLPMFHTATPEAFEAVFQEVLTKAPVRLQESLNPSRPNLSALPENGKATNDNGERPEKKVKVISLIGSASLKNRKSLAHVEADLRAFLDKEVEEARDKGEQLELRHGAGHGGCMESFNLICAKYAHQYPDIVVSVVGITTPELLTSESNGKGTLSGETRVRVLTNRAKDVLGAADHIFCAPGGAGTLHELLLAGYAVRGASITFGGFQDMPEVKANLEACLAKTAEGYPKEEALLQYSSALRSR